MTAETAHHKLDNFRISENCHGKRSSILRLTLLDSVQTMKLGEGAESESPKREWRSIQHRPLG
jgi:hypothetical protein